MTSEISSVESCPIKGNRFLWSDMGNIRAVVSVHVISTLRALRGQYTSADIYHNAYQFLFKNIFVLLPNHLLTVYIFSCNTLRITDLTV